MSGLMSSTKTPQFQSSQIRSIIMKKIIITTEKQVTLDGLMTIGMLENGLHMADFECCEDAVMEDFTARCKVQLISQASEIAQKVIRELILRKQAV